MNRQSFFPVFLDVGAETCSNDTYFSGNRIHLEQTLTFVIVELTAVMSYLPYLQTGL